MTATVLTPDLDEYSAATVVEWCSAVDSTISPGDTLVKLMPVEACSECGETIRSSDEPCSECGASGVGQTTPMVPVTAQVTGRVASIEAPLGSIVRPGDLLAQIEKTISEPTTASEGSVDEEESSHAPQEPEEDESPDGADDGGFTPDESIDFEGALEADWNGRTLRVHGDWTIRWLFLAPTYELMLDDRVLVSSGGPTTRPHLEASILEADGSQFLVSAELVSIVGYRPTCQILVDGEVVGDGHVRVANFLHPILTVFVVLACIVIWYLGPKGLAFIVYTLTEYARHMLGLT